MPPIDKLASFTVPAGQAITASAGSDIIDLGASLRDIGAGEPVKVEFVVTEAFTDAGSDSTVVVTLETDQDSAFGSPTLAVQTIGTFAALSAIGTKLSAMIQPGKIRERYMRAYFTVANGNLTTGKVAGYITDAFSNQEAYPSGTPVL